ncbi:ATP-dependent DNA helicase RecG, partial [Candidatus Roizmanbacteria bacterium]|nr:ATP-dependent DNA helicase RecG [Candidatus Roizmanbacteria bacterium]
MSPVNTNTHFLDTPISALPSTHALTIKRMQALGINTYEDLLNYYPFRYEDFSLISPINRLQEGELVTIKGTVTKATNEITRRGFKIQKVSITDQTGIIEAVWFNQPYLLNVIKQGTFVSISGEVKKQLRGLSLEPKEYEILRSLLTPTVHTATIVPVYPEKYGLSSRIFREKIHYVLDMLNNYHDEVEFLPESIRNSYKLCNELKAYQNIHFPQSHGAQKESIHRLSFDELFTIQLNTHLIKQEWLKETVMSPFEENEQTKIVMDNYLSILPFILTSAQTRCVDEILADLKRNRPMNRFLQGDVGSGKTVVASIACYFTHLNRKQSLVMAPTAILAVQHFETLSRLLSPFGLRVGLQTGTSKINKNSKIIDDFDVIVGTQALLTESTSFTNVGLIVIDEQHRFGVAQRALLRKKGSDPHLLTMTATPIPRTIALTLYGELDLSIIDEMPKGRLPIKTYLIPQAKRHDSHLWIGKQIRELGVQAYVICPLIEESETETMKSVKAANAEYEDLKRNVFKDFSVGLLHGKMKPKEKDQVMDEFKSKKYM